MLAARRALRKVSASTGISRGRGRRRREETEGGYARSVSQPVLSCGSPALHAAAGDPEPPGLCGSALERNGLRREARAPVHKSAQAPAAPAAPAVHSLPSRAAAQRAKHAVAAVSEPRAVEVPALKRRGDKHREWTKSTEAPACLSVRAIAGTLCEENLSRDRFALAAFNPFHATQLQYELDTSSSW